jgi:hypothetical protein
MVCRLPDDHRDPLSLFGWRVEENAAKTLLPWDQDWEISTTLDKLCALGSKFYPQRYPQGLNRVRRRIGPAQIRARQPIDSFVGLKA